MKISTRILVPMAAGVVACGILAAGATTFAADPALSPITGAYHGKKAWMAPVTMHRAQSHAGQIARMTPTTVTISWENRKSQTLPLANLMVRAGVYPATSGLLALGERVLLWGSHTKSPQLVVLPVAHGVLTQNQGGWSVVNAKHSVVLKGSPQQVFGLTSLTANTHVMVFGQRTQDTVTPYAIAARPQWDLGTVIANKNGWLTVKTKTNHNLRLSIAGLPMAERIAKVPVGHAVVVVSDPLSHKPLAVFPRHHQKMQGMGGQFSAGRLISDNGQTVVVKNPVASDTISLAGETVTIKWHNHPGAVLSQVPLGTPVLLRKTGPDTLVIRVF